MNFSSIANHANGVIQIVDVGAEPAVANYVLRPGDAASRALALNVLRIEEGIITEIVTFAGPVFLRFGLPLTIDEQAGEKDGRASASNPWKGGHHDSHINHHRGGRYTMNAPPQSP